MPNRIKELRKAKGVTIEALAEITGLSVSYVNRLEQGKRNLSLKNMEKIAEALDVAVKSLVQSPGCNVLLVGEARAGRIELFEGPRTFRMVAGFDGATSDTVAITVEDNSFGEMFKGWVLFYDTPQRPSDEMIGTVCAVWLEDGTILVRKVMKGERPDTFSLLSSFYPPIYDIKIVKAAPIRDMRQELQERKVRNVPKLVAV